MCVYFDGRMV
jgi:nucleoporin GLE1